MSFFSYGYPHYFVRFSWIKSSNHIDFSPYSLIFSLSVIRPSLILPSSLLLYFFLPYLSPSLPNTSHFSLTLTNFLILSFLFTKDQIWCIGTYHPNTSLFQSNRFFSILLHLHIFVPFSPHRMTHFSHWF